ncbi:MAG: glycoside hydrolase family 38 C-terminal domain-containing protein [Kiritimatiellales bacterium]
MPEKQQIFLLCNAHIDPVWLWEWEEGAAEAISTFRTAAELCEQNDTFIFNHNEVMLYRWVQEYAPELFVRIQNLVKAGRWHIMGGWFLQPDCNMPSGEALVRQVLIGKRWFKKYFGIEPSTALNIDPFGHSRGLVQILAKSGYDSYFCGRPEPRFLDLPADDFVWRGFDGSEVMATRFCGWYNSPLGEARKTIEERIAANPKRNPLLVLWGVGNHGGGPSRKDIQDVNELIAERNDVELMHSTPEMFFAKLAEKKNELPVFERDLNPWGVGCYTSQIQVKQKYRRLENELFMTEKMCAAAALCGLMDYPRADFSAALNDLLNLQFHDILPGTAIEPAEDAALRQAGHGLEILSRIRVRAFFALSAGERKANDGEIPVLVYNPHPVSFRQTVECEFNLADVNRGETFSDIHVFSGGKQIPAQVEKESSTVRVQWRKRVVFSADLQPGMNRFDCVPVEIPAKPEIQMREENGQIVFKTPEIDVVINTKTGLIDRYAVAGKNILRPDAFAPIVIADNEDPWGMHVTSFRNTAGKFELMTPEKGSQFSGLEVVLDSVRIIEDGDARSVVEALLRYGDSFICQRYKLPKTGTEIEVEMQVYWFEKDKMLKLEIPVEQAGAHRFLGQTVYGVHELPVDGTETVSQKWVAAATDETAVTCINDGVYGADFSGDGLRITLLRSPGYAYHPGPKPKPQTQYIPRSDQGRRSFRFWINAGKTEERLEQIESEALIRNEKPMTLSFFPSGAGKKVPPVIRLSDPAVQLSAFKKAEDGDDYMIRLFEPTGKNRTAKIALPLFNREEEVTLTPFEVKTFRMSANDGSLTEQDLLEH